MLSPPLKGTKSSPPPSPPLSLLRLSRFVNPFGDDEISTADFVSSIDDVSATSSISSTVYEFVESIPKGREFVATGTKEVVVGEEEEEKEEEKEEEEKFVGEEEDEDEEEEIEEEIEEEEEEEERLLRSSDFRDCGLEEGFLFNAEFAATRDGSC